MLWDPRVFFYDVLAKEDPIFTASGLPCLSASAALCPSVLYPRPETPRDHCLAGLRTKKACSERHPRSVYYANTVDGAGRTDGKHFDRCSSLFSGVFVSTLYTPSSLFLVSVYVVFVWGTVGDQRWLLAGRKELLSVTRRDLFVRRLQRPTCA